MNDFDSLRWLATQGARFALPYGRSKNQFEEGWPNKPHTLEEAITHARSKGNVGILTGKHSGGIVAIDRDVHFPETIEMLGDLGKTTKIIRDNAPERGKFLYRVDGDLPPSAVWKENPTDKHPACEFLAKGRHALTDPSESEGGHYRLIDTNYGIQAITLVELDYIWRLVTGGSLHKEQRAKEDAEQEKANKDDFVRRVKEEWTVEKVFDHFHRIEHGTAKDKGETRLLGNGGLLVSADGKQWYCHADSIGGDNLDAWAYCQWSKKIDRANPKMFWDVVNGMADAAGIAKPPAPPKATTNGTHKAQEAPEWAAAPATPQKNDQKSTSQPPDNDAYLLTKDVYDEGNAQCTRIRYQQSILHSKALGWLYHTGAYWSMSESEAAVDRAIIETLIARMSAAVNAKRDNETIKKFVPSSGHMQGAKTLLRSLVSAEAEHFDCEPDFLNCRNGVVNLRTGVLSPHSSSQRFLHCTTVDYRADANPTPWVNWLVDAVGKEAADWLQIAAGYGLTGHTREEILFYLFGPSRSGKGTFTETMLALMGTTLAREVDFGTFIATRTGDSQNFDLAPLKPCRFIAASETNTYERFNEAKVKKLTGGNDIYCAFKHRDHFNYRPQFKIWLSSNQPVNADPDDDAVWGRIRVVEFPHSHLGNEDKALKAAMRSESVLQGVLAWAVVGAQLWYELGTNGLPELETSSRVKAAQRAELDNVQTWIDEHCYQGENAFTPNDTLYPNYEQWCKANGVEPKKQKAFSQSLKRKGFADDRSAQKRGFRGIGIHA